LGEFAFEGSLGVERSEEFSAERLVDAEVFGGEDDDASGESVTGGVEGGAAFAGIGASTTVL
jgi:hypothetical protein